MNVFKVFKQRVPSRTSVGKRPQRAAASKAKSSVLSQLSGLENVLFNDFIDAGIDSEDESEQRASASLPDSVPIDGSEEERVHVLLCWCLRVCVCARARRDVDMCS
jgi:hypothetical protein